MRIVNGETLWRIRALLEKKMSCEKDLELLKVSAQNLNLQRENVNGQIELCKTHIENAILLEKKRLNIPDPWIFDPESGEFKDPQTMPEEERTRLGV